MGRHPLSQLSVVSWQSWEAAANQNELISPENSTACHPECSFRKNVDVVLLFIGPG